MAVDVTPEQVRAVAIGHHHSVASTFEQYYRDLSQDRFRNAFTYGREKVDRVLDVELKRLRPGAKILDVGCGTGVYLQRFRELGFDPEGVEPAEGMREAARRLDPTLHISSGVATALPFPDATFDLVTEIEVLRYLHRADIRQAMREIFRVLRPGGRAFVTMVNRFALDGFYVHYRLRQRVRGSAFDETNPHCEFFTPAELERELSAAGGTHARTQGCLFGPMRIAYKVNEGLAAKLARSVEAYDDALCAFHPVKPFTGHLIGIAERA